MAAVSLRIQSIGQPTTFIFRDALNNANDHRLRVQFVSYSPRHGI